MRAAQIHKSIDGWRRLKRRKKSKRPKKRRKQRNGKQLGGTVDYGDPVVIRDDRDGSVTLYTKYEDYQAYQPVPMDEELKDDIIRAMGKTAYYEEPFAHYHIISDIQK